MFSVFGSSSVPAAAAATVSKEVGPAAPSALAALALSEIVPYHDFAYILKPPTKKKDERATKKAKIQVEYETKENEETAWRPNCLPSGEFVVSYRKPQTGDLARLGYNIFGLHFEGRFVPFEQHQRLTPDDHAWLQAAIERRIDADRQVRAAKGVTLTQIMYARPGTRW